MAESRTADRKRRPNVPADLDVQAECQRYARKTVDKLNEIINGDNHNAAVSASRVLLEFAHGKPQSADKKPVKNRRVSFNMQLAPSPDEDASTPPPRLEDYEASDAGNA